MNAEYLRVDLYVRMHIRDIRIHKADPLSNCLLTSLKVKMLEECCMKICMRLTTDSFIINIVSLFVFFMSQQVPQKEWLTFNGLCIISHIAELLITTAVWTAIPICHCFSTLL